jgi:type II secretory pathway pseudopilin PulG
LNPISQYQFPPEKNEPVAFGRGFSLAVMIILAFAALIIGGLIFSFQKTTDAANARLVYLAAQARAIEFAASDSYHVPVQADLLDYIGPEVNQEAVITVVDENRDAIIDAIIYTRSGLVTRYSPGNLEAEKEK